jgi:hypothetical protein
VLESKMNVRTLQNNYTHISQNLPKKANRLNQTYEKLSMQQASDDVSNTYTLELAEDDFQLSDTFQAIVAFASVFTLVYIFGLKSFKKLKSAIHSCISEHSSVKKFILIRSIRI